MMRKLLNVGAVLCAILTIGSEAVFAHHSTMMFDRTKIQSIVGTVAELQWTNPHVIIWMIQDAQDGAEPVQWAIEMSSPGNLRRSGWTKTSLVAGDRVSIDVNPLNTGQPGGRLRKATILDTGEELRYGYLPEQLE
jgi:hypothetical protein